MSEMIDADQLGELAGFLADPSTLRYPAGSLRDCMKGERREQG